MALKYLLTDQAINISALFYGHLSRLSRWSRVRVSSLTQMRNHAQEILVNPRRACAARVTVLGLSVRLSVCLSLYLYSRTTGNEAVRERYTRLQHNKRSKNNVANFAITAAF